MKVARFLLVPALLAAIAGAAQGQTPMPDPAMMGPPGGGSPAMLGGDCYPGGGGGYGGNYCYPGEMAPGPVYSDCPPDGRQPFGRLRQRSSRGYFSADALMLHQGGGSPRDIANVGAVNILNNSQLDYGLETLPRITAGFILPNDVAIEGTIFYKDDFDAHATTTTVGPFTSPLISAAAPPAGTSNYVNANIIDEANSTSIHNYELNIVETTRIFKFLSGFRYLEADDVMTVTAVEGAQTSRTRIATDNQMFGGQMGYRAGYDWELFGIETGGKAGYFFNDSSQQTQIRDVNSTQLRRNTTGGGDNDAFIGELHAKITYRPLPYLAIQMGYQAYWITGVALAADQLNPQFPNQSGIGINDKGDLFYHGPSVGMEARW
ncbi:MAG: BBP7 family outer membrane beta-barrel protein [Planctomycetales bacterium]|nr:BBP7 family outer membrane beta-barrel protein [Planctomycetales bacterium]MBN8625914.1 BBP7 family outer membrane beta-barrel protein [Planctomycetota bacterium]